ncbi:ABC transporter substrate-binding protein [Rhizobium skierniewicense]|uniref:ABC transporter substrate-binding protein n=1 Tax=Rhizobium skierniewicense TaxID=984260 RepID=UPI001572FB85|nr:ABC transporter substrate-binding protein [Rhizobium skierniewicense]NTF35062.1 ABC transporter substrate-binding protein [Rhizobium skierniewicense]
MHSRRDFLALSLVSLMGMRSNALASANPSRIVAIDWAAAESLLALGVTPAAVSDTGYFRQRMPLPLPDNVLDIGPFWEINRELLAEIAPDVILINSSSLIMTPDIARVGRVETVPEKVRSGDRYDLSIEILYHAGKAAGLEPSRMVAVAARGLERFDALRARLPARSRRVCVLLPDQTGRGVVVYGKGSLPDAVLRRLGLENAWQGPVNAAGVFQTGFDALFDLEEAIFILIDIPALRQQTTRGLEKSALWQALPPVNQGRTNWIGQFYPFGGCISALHLAESMTAVLEGAG